MNMVGYPLVLPDMIAGNGYTAVWGETVLPSKELFVRWLQANTFMPALQFSIVPVSGLSVILSNILSTNYINFFQWDYEADVSLILSFALNLTE